MSGKQANFECTYIWRGQWLLRILGRELARELPLRATRRLQFVADLRLS